MAHRPVVPDGVFAVELDGRLCVYVPEREQVAVLNESASLVWSLVDGERDLDEMTSAVAVAYAVQPTEVADDVRDAVEGLVDSGLLTRAEQS